MANKITWELNNTNPDNSTNFDTVSQWWLALENQEIAFAQRLLHDTNQAEDVNWEAQRFDETLTLTQTRIGGITLYWHSPKNEQERSITPTKLELDVDRQQFYIYSKTQQNLIIRITKTQPTYQTYNLNNPKIAGAQIGDRMVLLFQDEAQNIEIKLTLDSQNLTKLQNIISPVDTPTISLQKPDN
ncbi:MAG: hypothetical protein SAJ72_02325 [Jaaginema sp. PMC 1080.18]|nr:hypothetical protein [Jaaginema sp. PMC 1080.18]MEC4868535.1 hypothetical protein [Jaaginema sp. PMC 1078.18]